MFGPIFRRLFTPSPRATQRPRGLPHRIERQEVGNTLNKPKEVEGHAILRIHPMTASLADWHYSTDGVQYSSVVFPTMPMAVLGSSSLSALPGGPQHYKRARPATYCA
jgi:hypothetical protein